MQDANLLKWTGTGRFKFGKSGLFFVTNPLGKCIVWYERLNLNSSWNRYYWYLLKTEDLDKECGDLEGYEGHGKSWLIIHVRSKYTAAAGSLTFNVNWSIFQYRFLAFKNAAYFMKILSQSRSKLKTLLDRRQPPIQATKKTWHSPKRLTYINVSCPFDEPQDSNKGRRCQCRRRNELGSHSLWAWYSSTFEYGLRRNVMMR